jgi:hypothetical protein
MDRRITSTMVVAVAALLINQRATRDYTPAPAVGPEAATVPSRESAAGPCTPNEDCNALISYAETGPWVASCGVFGSSGRPGPPRGESIRLDSRAGDTTGQDVANWCLPAGTDAPVLSFLIVMVPDPVRTHLALYFDRTIEAVEAAAQRQELFLDRYWLPWSPPRTAAPGDTSRDARVNAILTTLRLSQPGVLIFTASGDKRLPHANCVASKPCVVYAFLVSESPTSGINRAQFANAINYATVLSGTPRPVVEVVGPFFSGSAPSAASITAHWPSDGPKLDFISGTMTSETQSASLCAALASSNIRFRQTLHTDAVAQRFLLDFLSDHGLTTLGGNVAILQEDETRFGNSLTMPQPSGELPAFSLCGPATTTEGKFPNVHYIKFPRELSRLRNASADTFGAVPAVPGQPAALPSDGITWNWKDVSGGEDSVPSFSGSQEPLSQQAVMLSISDTIRQQNIKYVGIAATDIFDTLFLSKFLKIAAPNTRVFVLNADILMVRTSAEGRELDGTLAVTTYPLFDRNRLWTTAEAPKQTAAGAAPSSIDVFPSRIAEGVYNAVLFALDLDGPSREYVDPLLTEIPNDRPALWLTVVGRDGFWPVKVQPNEIFEKQRAPSPGLGIDFPHTLTFDAPDGVTLFLEGLLLVWGVLHWLGLCFAGPGGYTGLQQFEITNQRGDREHAQHQLYYLLCATLALSAMLLLVAISCAWLCAHGRISFGPPRGLFSAFYALIALLGLALLAGAIAITRGLRRRFVGLVFQSTPWILYVGVLGSWAWLNSSRHVVGLFFAQRAFYLTNHVSPLLPIELLLLMYYVWAWTFIRKVRISDIKQVRVPDLALLGAGGLGLKRSLAELRVATDGLSFDACIAPMMALAFIAVIGVLLRPWELLHSVEGSWYDWLIVALVWFFCVLIAIAWGRYLFMWSRLRRVLRGLERTPLRRAFSRLPNAYSWSQLWYEDAERRAYIISARSLECYQALVACTGVGARQLVAMSSAFRRVVESDDAKRANASRSNAGRSDAVRNLQRIFVTAARQILRGGLAERWAVEGGSDSLDVAAERRASDPPDGQARCRLIAEEFIALRYIGLIHYQSAQMKNLVGLLAIGFILALLAVGSYPFLGGRQCVWSLAGIFVLFGAAVIVSFAQMDRDAILSRLSGTDPGKLDWSFVLRVGSYGGLPLLALLASQFPSLGRSLFSWLEPALNALH